jgi:hypothetical protein
MRSFTLYLCTIMFSDIFHCCWMLPFHFSPLINILFKTFDEMVVVPYFHAMRRMAVTPYSCLSVLQIIYLGHLFYTRQFSSYLQEDLLRPKGVQTIEKHAKHKHNILKVPGDLWRHWGRGQWQDFAGGDMLGDKLQRSFDLYFVGRAILQGNDVISLRENSTRTSRGCH